MGCKVVLEDEDMNVGGGLCKVPIAANNTSGQQARGVRSESLRTAVSHATI